MPATTTQRYLLAIVSGLLALASLAQPLRTKDGVVLGDRMEFINSCQKAAGKEMMKLDGVDMDTRRYCACVMDLVIPALTWKEIAALEEDKQGWLELMLSERFLDQIVACAKDNMRIDEDASLADMTTTDLARRMFLINCRKSALAELEPGPWAELFAERYCACALERMIEADLDYGELMVAESTDGRAFNEVVIPCLNAFTRDLQILERATQKGGVFDCSVSVVPLVDLLGQGYNLKLSFGGVVRYFLLDTGASDLVIGSDLVAELERKGVLTKANDLGEFNAYTLANGDTVQARMVMLDEVVIGECRVENVLAAVVDGGSLLCGRSFLDRFSHWEIQGSKGVLLLRR
jgi:clan AA aspartic protease (TIGR02281 family)